MYGSARQYVSTSEGGGTGQVKTQVIGNTWPPLVTSPQLQKISWYLGNWLEDFLNYKDSLLTDKRQNHNDEINESESEEFSFLVKIQFLCIFSAVSGCK